MVKKQQFAMEIYRDVGHYVGRRLTLWDVEGRLRCFVVLKIWILNDFQQHV